jgi:ribosomal protein S18 acetylase RimI-like enzyme
MIRPVTPADTVSIVALTEATGFFKPIEIEALGEVLSDYHAHAAANGHICVCYEHEHQLAGFAYYAPAAMTDRTWYLYWIAVSKTQQAKGLGGALFRYGVEDMRRRQGRILLIETSSQPLYEPTRRFYIRHNCEQAAVLRDYYADGDDMIIFRKRLHQ